MITTMHGNVRWDREANGLEMEPENEAVMRGLAVLLRHSDLVVYPSEYMQEWVAGHLDVRSPGLVRPNCLSGLKRSVTAPRRDREPVDEIVYFGRVDERKGIAVFEQAVTALAGRSVDGSRIAVLGRLGYGDAAVLDRLRAMGARVVENYDSLEAVNYLRVRNCVAVVPSLCDNSPYTVYEALASGIPLVAADTGGIAELIHPDERQRILVDPGDADALVTRLEECLADGATAAGLAFDPDEVRRAHLELHATITRRRAPRSPAEWARLRLLMLRARPGPLVVFSWRVWRLLSSPRRLRSRVLGGVGAGDRGRPAERPVDPS